MAPGKADMYNGAAMMRLNDPDERSRWTAAYEWASPRLIPAFLVVLGVTIAVWGAYLSPQPPPGQLAFLQLLASAFNVLGGLQFARIGKADPKHARSAVRRLYTLGESLTLASAHLQTAIASGEDQKVTEQVQVVLSQVESANRQLIDAIGDWNDIHSEALREVRRSQTRAAQAREGVTGRD